MRIELLESNSVAANSVSHQRKTGEIGMDREEPAYSSKRSFIEP
jgi:hypothetical protein